MKALVAVVAALVLAAPLARAEEVDPVSSPPARARSGRFTYGGSLGFGIGDSTWGVSLRGEAGYLVTERLWTGVSGRFQWTHDERYTPTLDSVDYGVGAYARYFVFERFFASGEWDWTSYEPTTAWGGAAARESVSSFLVGGGYGQPIGPRSIFLVEALYDVTGEARGLYGTPWVTRFSFVMGF